MENDNIKYYGLCFEWILSRKDIMTDPEKKKRYKYQFATFLKKQNLSFEAIYSFLMLKGLTDDKPEGMSNKEYLHKLFDSEIKYEDCYYYYSEFDKNKTMCRVCQHCKMDTNMFAKEEKEILLSCMMRSTLAEVVVENEKNGPIFNSVITDGFFKNSDKTCIPACIMLLPRMIFNDIVIGKESDEEFINSIDNKYGDVNAARKCAKDYLNMLNVEKSQLTKPLLTKAKINSYCKRIHEEFGEKMEFPPMGIVKKKRKHPVEQISLLDTFPAVKEAEKITEANILRVKNEEKQKKNLEPKKEINTQVAYNEESVTSQKNDKKNIPDNQNQVKKEVETPEIQKPVLKNNEEKVSENVQETIEEKTKKEIKKINNVPFLMTRVLDDNVLDNLIKVNGDEADIEQMENEIVNDAYVCCDIFYSLKGTEFLVIYVECSKKYYCVEMNNKEAMKTLLRYFKNDNVEIYTSLPWLLCRSIYAKYDVIVTNVLSVYRFFSILYPDKKMLLSNAIEDICGSKDNSGNIDLFYLSRYAEFFQKAKIDAYEKDLMAIIKETSNMDILYGISMDCNTITNNNSLVKLSPEGKISYDDEPLETSSKDGICFRLNYNAKSSDNTKITPSTVYRMVLNDYITDGRLKKCVPYILRINETGYYIRVENEDEYDYLYDIFSFYGRRISLKLNVKMQMRMNRF